MHDKEYLEIIERFNLQPHPEGGFYRETYRSAETIVLPEYLEPRNVSTAIYYLLTGDTFSAFHRFKSDELWHFYRGDSLNIYILNEITQNVDVIYFGDPITEPNAAPQVMIPKNTWFAAEHKVKDPSAYTFLGCTVAPGFDFKDFELGSRTILVKKFPHATAEITRLTREM